MTVARIWQFFGNFLASFCHFWQLSMTSPDAASQPHTMTKISKFCPKSIIHFCSLNLKWCGKWNPCRLIAIVPTWHGVILSQHWQSGQLNRHHKTSFHIRDVTAGATGAHQKIPYGYISACGGGPFNYRPLTRQVGRRHPSSLERNHFTVFVLSNVTSLE